MEDGARIQSMDEPSADDSPERGPDDVFCRNCGAVISEQAEIGPECGVRQRDPPKSSLDSVLDDLTRGGNPFVAAVLSAILPGLGQIYDRELEKGLIIIVGSFLAALSVLVAVGLVLVPAIWIYAIYDAYKVAERQGVAAGPTPDVADAATGRTTVAESDEHTTASDRPVTAEGDASEPEDETAADAEE